MVVLCVLAAVLLIRQQPVPDPGAAKTGAGASGLALNAALPDGAQLNQWANLDAPLEAETQLVIGDARRALDSLTKNFVPEELLASWSAKDGE